MHTELQNYAELQMIAGFLSFLAWFTGKMSELRNV